MFLNSLQGLVLNSQKCDNTSVNWYNRLRKILKINKAKIFTVRVADSTDFGFVYLIMPRYLIISDLRYIKVITK